MNQTIIHYQKTGGSVAYRAVISREGRIWHLRVTEHVDDGYNDTLLVQQTCVTKKDAIFEADLYCVTGQLAERVDRPAYLIAIEDDIARIEADMAASEHSHD